MAVTGHIFPSFTLNAAKKTLDASSDTLKVLLIASGTYTWGAIPETHKTVNDFLGGDGTHGALTEVSTSGTGYTRQTLASVTITDSGLVTTLTCANVVIAASTFSAVYALFYDNTVGAGSDAANQIICYWDFGGTSTATGSAFTLQINASGLAIWTSS